MTVAGWVKIRVVIPPLEAHVLVDMSTWLLNST